MPDVAGLGVLGQTGGRPEADHLSALGRRPVVGQHQQTRVRVGDLQIAQLGRTDQGAEVEDRHVRGMLGEGDGQPFVGYVGGHQPEAGILVHERLQSAADRPRVFVTPAATGGGQAAATTELDQSTTEVGLTTCLLIPSSLGDSPRARPTSCGR